MSRRVAAAIAVVVVVGLATPVVTDRDSFPVSTYPMFSQPRTSETTVGYAVGLDRGGGDDRLPPEVVGGTAEVVHAAETIRQARRRDDLDGLCNEMAARLAGRDGDVVEVEIRLDTYDVVGWFEGRRDPLERDVLARCPVPPGATG